MLSSHYDLRTWHRVCLNIATPFYFINAHGRLSQFSIPLIFFEAGFKPVKLSYLCTLV